MNKQKDLEGHIISDYEELIIQCNELRREFDNLTGKYERESLVCLNKLDVIKKEMTKIRQKSINV